VRVHAPTVQKLSIVSTRNTRQGVHLHENKTDDDHVTDKVKADERVSPRVGLVWEVDLAHNVRPPVARRSLEEGEDRDVEGLKAGVLAEEGDAEDSVHAHDEAREEHGVEHRRDALIECNHDLAQRRQPREEADHLACSKEAEDTCPSAIVACKAGPQAGADDDNVEPVPSAVEEGPEERSEHVDAEFGDKDGEEDDLDCVEKALGTRLGLRQHLRLDSLEDEVEEDHHRHADLHRVAGVLGFLAHGYGYQPGRSLGGIWVQV
jgi:hypothetical protein